MWKLIKKFDPIFLAPVILSASLISYISDTIHGFAMHQTSSQLQGYLCACGGEITALAYWGIYYQAHRMWKSSEEHSKKLIQLLDEATIKKQKLAQENIEYLERLIELGEKQVEKEQDHPHASLKEILTSQLTRK